MLAYSLVFLSQFGVIQLGLAGFFSLCEIVFLLRVKPFKANSDTAVNVVSEFCLLGVYGSIGAMQLVQFEVQISLVWACVGCVLTGNTVGFWILVRKKSLECKKERRRKKELTELRERVSRKAETSILSMIHPLCKSANKSLSSRGGGIQTD